jgi:uncharacterized protein (DUF433 family)
MATRQYRIVSGEDSDLHDEPHVEGSRITVRDVHERVEKRGLSPTRVAERYDLAGSSDHLYIARLRTTDRVSVIR